MLMPIGDTRNETRITTAAIHRSVFSSSDYRCIKTYL